MSDLIDSYLVLHHNHFGFTTNVGCSKAVFAFSSCAKYFRDKDYDMYFCTLDATKAFDRENHFFLFKCLEDCGIPWLMFSRHDQWYGVVRVVEWQCILLLKD